MLITVHHVNKGTPDTRQKDQLHHHRLKKPTGLLEIKGPRHPVEQFRSLQAALRPHNTALCHHIALCFAVMPPVFCYPANEPAGL